MNGRKQKPLLLIIIILAVASIGVMLIARYPFSGDGRSASEVEEQERMEASRTLADTGDSQYLTVFVYREDGEMAAYMVGGQTTEFDDFHDAMEGASLIEGQKDESYADLLVFSFADGTTMEVAYSPASNTIAFNSSLYSLPVELQPLIAAVEERFNE